MRSQSDRSRLRKCLAQCVSDRGIVTLFCFSMSAIVVIGFASFLFGLNLTIHLFFASLSTSFAAIAVKVIRDNSPLPFSIGRLCPLILASFLIWLPLGALGIIGFGLTSWCDRQIDFAIGAIHSICDDRIRMVEQTIESEVSATIWYEPWTWGGWGKRKVIEVTMVPVVEHTHIAVRIFFGVLYSALRLAQYVYYGTCLLAVIKSFAYVFVRVAVKQQYVVTFRLPRQ
jgi:hypothetical protein